MIIAIHQAEHVPWLGYLEKMRQVDIFVILDNVQFTKNNFQNRNRIIDQNQTLKWLSVPVKTKNHLNKKFYEIEICYDHNWQKKYLDKLYYCYSKTENFKLYVNIFEQIILTNYKYLLELNMTIINFFCDIFKVKTPIILASTLGVEAKSNQLLLNICKMLNAKIYLSGLGGKNYLQEEIFSKELISVNYYSFNHPLYIQTDCRYYLSSLDLIFKNDVKKLLLL